MWNTLPCPLALKQQRTYHSHFICLFIVQLPKYQPPPCVYKRSRHFGLVCLKEKHQISEVKFEKYNFERDYTIATQKLLLSNVSFLIVFICYKLLTLRVVSRETFYFRSEVTYLLSQSTAPRARQVKACKGDLTDFTYVCHFVTRNV